MLDQIIQYDIYSYELDSLEVVLVATHDEGYWNIVDQMVGLGISVNRIKLLHNQDADYANVWIESDATTVRVNWIRNDRQQQSSQSSKNTPDLGQLIKCLAQ